MAIYRVTSRLTSGVLMVRTSDGKSTPIAPGGHADFTEQTNGMLRLAAKGKLSITKIAGDPVLLSDLPPEVTTADKLNAATSPITQKHNALLTKLDDDDGVNDTDYVSKLKVE